jgi:hypothetical protein
MNLPPQLQNTCQVCHRSSTEDLPIVLRPLLPEASFNGQIVKRQFGDKQGMNEQMQVCSQCSHFVCPATQRQKTAPSWVHAWPAVIWTCLSKTHYIDVLAFMCFLPFSLRLSWTHVIHD